MVGLPVFWHHLCPWAREVAGAKGTTRLGKGILGARPARIFNDRQTHKRSRDRQMSIDLRSDSGVASADTIVAMSTAPGRGAIGIVRMSGPEALRIAEMAFRPARGPGLDPDETHRVLYGHVLGRGGDSVIDEALLVVMLAPRTYTREDVVEIHCHGGPAAQREVLREIIGLGARLADPGEFTRRAFVNGRIDLTQAESVASIVSAKSSAALRASVRQLGGGLSDKLRAVRKRLIEVLAQLEVTVDFADEDVDNVDWANAVATLGSVETELRSLLDTAFLGRALEQGVSTAIVGRPNVGKSSLLNALLMKERAIVSEIPGTTRDTVEELIEIGGIPLHLVDTAGIRSGGDHIEQMGVERSRQAMEEADLVLAVFDLSILWEPADTGLLEGLDPARSIVVGNKVDLVQESDVRRLTEKVAVATGREDWSICAVSAAVGSGLGELRETIQRKVAGEQGMHLEEPILATERQRNLVKEALEGTEAALDGSKRAEYEELVCEDIRVAVKALGLITGQEITSDLLDEIFSRFCIGK